MKDNATPQGGFWMLIEDLRDESDKQNDETNTEKKEAFKDSYDFFPDSGF